MQVSFGRGIKVISDKDCFKDKHDGRIDPYTEAVLNSTAGVKSYLIEPEVSQEAGNFLRKHIGDYKKDTGLYIKRIQGDIYIFTGKEAPKAKQIADRAYKTMVSMRQKGKMSAFKKRLLLQKRDEELLKMTENGKRGKYTDIKISTDFNKDHPSTISLEYFTAKMHKGEEKEIRQINLTI